MENFLNVNQAAFILKVHPLTIRRYIKEGKLKAVRAAGNIRIKESSLQDFHKEVVPQPIHNPSVLKKPSRFTKIFDADDPLFRLKGLGAGIQLTNK